MGAGGGGGDSTCGRGFLSGTRKGPPSFSRLLFFPFFPFSPPLENRGRDPYGNVPGVGHTRYIPWAEEGNGGTFSQVTVLRDWDEELDPGDCWVVSQGSTEQGLGVRGGGFGLALGFGLGLGCGRMGRLPHYSRSGGASRVSCGPSGGGWLWGFWRGGGGQSSPRWCCRRRRYCCSACCCSSPLLLPHPHPNPCTAGSCPPPPVLPASRLPNPPPAYATRIAPRGPYWGHSPTSGPTRCPPRGVSGLTHRATPPAPRGGRLHTFAGSQPNKRTKRQVCSSDVLATF